MAQESKEMYEFRKQLKFLKKQRGQGTELISVYIKPGANVNETSNRLRDEYGQAANIKSKSTRKNVQTAIDRILTMLKGVNKPPEHGVAIFAGMIKNNVELFNIIPPDDITVSIYRCDSTFFTDPLDDMYEQKDSYGLVVMDRREATFALLKGKKTTVFKHITSTVPGKHHKGGQCVHSDSLVQLENGVITEIKNVAENDKVNSFNRSNYKNRSEKCDKVFSREWDESYVIKTKYPCMEIKTTPEHWFFIANDRGIGLKYAEDLKEGDQVLASSRTSIKGERIKTKTEIPVTKTVNKEGIDFLANKRKKLGISQKQIAEKIGIHAGTVSKFELKTGKISLENVKKIAKTCGVEWDSFSKKYVNETPLFSFPSEITPKLCQIVGYIMGDGNREKISVRMYDEDKQIIKHYSKIAEELFSVNVTIKRREKKNYYMATFYGEHLLGALEKNFRGMFNKSGRIQAPENIMKCGNEQITGFIRGLFDAEACVRENRVCISMIDEKLIKQLQIMLTRFGIISSVKHKLSKPNHRVKKQSNQFELEISDAKSLETFKKEIGFSSLKKSEKLSRIKKHGLTKTDQIPATGRHVLELVRKMGFNTRSFGSAGNFFRNERNMSKTVFEKNILKKVKENPENYPVTRELEKILNSDVIQATVSSIEKTKELGTFYDLSVPKTECFIANNFVLHNSAMRMQRLIEQATHEFFVEIGELCNISFAGKEVRAIIFGGPGPTKFSFLNGDYLFNNVKAKIKSTPDTSYTDETGIREVREKASDVIKDLEVAAEKDLLDRFLKEAVTNGLATYGFNEVKTALENGQADKLLLSEGVDEAKIDELTAIAEQRGTHIEMISEETAEGQQFRLAFAGIGAFLRYKTQ